MDTRALTRHIRTAGAMRGIISTEDLDPSSLVEKARELAPMEGSDWVKSVTCGEHILGTGGRRKKAARGPGSGLWEWGKGQADSPAVEKKYRVVAMDFGMKHNIVRHLASRGCEVRVVPARTKAEEILALKPHGIFLSNGPGDPAALPYIIETVRGAPGQEADLRHLPGPPAPGAGPGGQDL